MRTTLDSTPKQLELPFTITIPLTKGYSAIVDAVDADLSGLKWYTLVNSVTSYAVRKGKTTALMHRVILIRMLGRDLVKDEVVDHINGDGLDNRRTNLRLATRSENSMNQRLGVRNKSGFKGVSRCKSGYKWKWQAGIRINNKQRHLGVFDTPEEAYAAYCEAAKELHGEFARLK